MRYHYRLYDLRISSEIELPELKSQPDWQEPDVRIRLEGLPGRGGKSDELFADGAVAGFFIEDVAHYLVSAGREIIVDPRPDAPVRNVRLYLLGSAMGLLLHQRGRLPLHANAVETGDRGFAFMGPSGSGKSTLAAAFHDRGHQVIADDVCLVSFRDDGRAIAHGGAPRMRLWEDALLESGRTAGSYELSYAGDEQFRKFDVPIEQEATSSVPLSAIFELASAEYILFEKLRGLDAVEAIFANTYRGEFIAAAGDAKLHWQACMQLVSAVPVFRLHRPLGRSTSDQIIAQLESDAWLDPPEGTSSAND